MTKSIIARTVIILRISVYFFRKKPLGKFCINVFAWYAR